MTTSRRNNRGVPEVASMNEVSDEKRRIDEILQRPPPTPESAEELAAAAREFYEIAMKEKHEREKRQFLISAILVAMLGVAWYVLAPRS